MFPLRLPAARPTRSILRLFAAAALPALLASIGSCTGDPVKPPVTPAATPAVARVVAPGDTDRVIDDAPLERFKVTVTLAGAYRPGVPVQAVVRTTASIASPRARIRVVVPELDVPFVESAPGGKAKRPAKFATQSEWTSSLAAGATETRVVHLVFPRPGTYHVSAEAVHDAEGVTTANGRYVQHAASHMVEMVVSERGVTQRATDGPAAMMLPYCDPNIDPSCEPEPPPPPPPAPTVVWVYTAVWYSGPGMTTYDPVRRARVNYSGVGLPTGQTATDEAGYALLPCNPANNNTNITVTLEGADVRMTMTHTSVSTTLNMGPTCYGGGWVAWYNWSEGRAWDNLLKAIDGSRGYFGYARGRINARVGGVDSCDGNSCWLNGANEILIVPTSVWHEWGEFVAAHEYGHAYHAGLPYGIRVCGGPHSWEDTRQDGCLAHNEGFATFVALSARGAGSGLAAYYADHERDWRRTTCPGTANCETRVAAFLLDLADPVDPGDPDGFPDDLQLPARQVLDMTGQCALTFIQYAWEYDYVTNRWTQTQRGGLGEVWDCLLKNPPIRLGTMTDAQGRSVDLIIEGISHPWPALSGATLTAATTRYGR